MSPVMGDKLRVRSMIYVAGEPVPFFWPMRAFIHHNPLHGFEHLPFDQAVEKGTRLFHGRGYLPRVEYQRYLADGQVDRQALESGVRRFVETRPALPFDLADWLMAELAQHGRPVAEALTLAGADEVYAVLQGEASPAVTEIATDALAAELRETLLRGRPLYEVADALYGTAIGQELDEQVIRACLDFFDEGQSIWSMPNRERGFFRAWLDVAGKDVQRTLADLMRRAPDGGDDDPESIIALVFAELGVPEDVWLSYVTQELARLHGWAGFIRWRSNASHYYWEQRFPGDLVDYVAVRMLLALTLLRRRCNGKMPVTVGALADAIEADPFEFYLRREFYAADPFPAMAHRLEDTLLRGNRARIAAVFAEYRARKRRFEAERQADRLRHFADRSGLGEPKRVARQPARVSGARRDDLAARHGGPRDRRPAAGDQPAAAGGARQTSLRHSAVLHRHPVRAAAPQPRVGR